MAVPLTDEEYRLFQEWLSREYGLRYNPEKRDILRARLEPRRSELGFDSFEQLLFHLKFHPTRSEERERVLSALTNNESYFFREARQLELLRDEVLPELAGRLRPDQPLRVLSAGCAAGEEPYTLAIVLRESGWTPRRPARITGIDIDTAAIARAREAVYRQHAFRGVDEMLKGRFFRSEDTHFRLRDDVREAVAFKQANLLDAGWAGAIGPQHVAFCRNVLIYFDGAAVRKVISLLYDALAPGGYLFLGHAESLSNLPTRFKPVRRSGAIYYQKPLSA